MDVCHSVRNQTEDRNVKIRLLYRRGILLDRARGRPFDRRGLRPALQFQHRRSFAACKAVPSRRVFAWRCSTLFVSWTPVAGGTVRSVPSSRARSHYYCFHSLTLETVEAKQFSLHPGETSQNVDYLVNTLVGSPCHKFSNQVKSNGYWNYFLCQHSFNLLHPTDVWSNFTLKILSTLTFTLQIDM